MTSGMDIAFIGKITYYAIAVYILFFIGLLFVCRYRFKRKRARRDERKLQANQPKDHRDNQSFKERGCSSPIDQDSCKSQEVFEDMGKSQSKSYKVSNSTVDELKGPRKRKVDGPNAPNSAEKEERPPTAPPTTGVTMGVKSDVSTKIHDDRCIENSKVKPLHSERASVKFERKVYVETVEINYTITVGSENQVDVGGDSKEKDIDNNDQVRDISSSEFIPVDISCQTTKDDTVVVDSTDKESEETAESVEIPISNEENLQKDDDEMGVQSDDHIKANLDLGYSVNSYTSVEKLASQLSEAVINNSIDAACGILCKECECAKESAVSISLARVESMKMPCLSSEPEQNYDEIDNYAQHVSSAIIGDAVESVGKCSIPKDMERSNNQRFLEGVSELADNIVEASIENGINDLFGHHDLKGSTSSLNSAVSASETNIAECKSEREDAITIHAHQLSKQILEDAVKDVTYILSLRKQSSLEASQLQKDCIYDISEKVTSKVIQDAVKMAAYLLAKQRIIEKSKELSKNGPPSQLIKFKMNHFANKLSSGLVKSSIQQTRSRPLIKGANGSVSRLNPSIVQQIHSARTKVVGQYAQRLAGSVSEAALHKAKHAYSPEGRAGEDFFDLLTRTVISEAMHELFDKSVHPRNCSRSEGIMPDLSTKVKDFGKSDEITFDISTRDNERKISFREDMENVDVISSQEHNVIPQFTEHGADSIVGEKPLDSVTIIHEAIKNSSESNVEKDNEIATPQTSEIIDPQQSENSNKHPNEKDVDLNNESCGSIKQVIRKKMSQASLASPVEPNISLSYHNSSTDADAEYDGYDSSEEFSDSSEDEVVDYSVRHHVKKVGADRPLSGYAEKLAQLLAIEDDDDDLEFLDSDDEMDTVLEKIEKKYPRNRKISREVHRIRKHSINKDTDATHIKADRELKPLESDLLSDLLNNDDSFVFSDDDDSLISTSPAKNADVPPVPRDDDVCKTGYQSNRQSMSPGVKQLSTAAVIDLGSGIVKAGFAGSIAPRCMLPSVIGVPRRFSQDVSKMTRGCFVGEEAISKAGMLQLAHPLKPPISNWTDVNSLLEYVLEVELGTQNGERPILLTETGLTDRKHREKLTEIMFERFGTPGFYLANQGPLSLYSMGLLTGVCLNSGFSMTESIPVYEGCVLPHAIRQLNVGGEQISNYLGRLLLSTKGHSFNSSSEKFILSLIKEKIGYVAEDPEAEAEQYRKYPDDFSQVFTLPDGQEIEIGTERYSCSEILYDPQELGLAQPSLPHLIMESIASCSADLRSTMANHCLVTGGTTLLPGFNQRLQKELKNMTEHTTAVRLSNSSNPIVATWVGGSVLSSLSTFSQQWISVDEYAEVGAEIVHMKCF